MKNISIKWALYVGAIFIVLATLIYPDYFGLDEPNMLWSIRLGKGWSEYYGRFISEGRFFYGVIQLISIQLAGTLNHLKYLRVISIILTFLFCRMIFLYLQKQGVKESISLIISVMIFSLPGFSAYISWAECFPNLIAAILSFYAGTLAAAVFAKHLGEKELSKSKENGYVFFAITLQVISLFIYQGLLAFVIPAFFLLILKAEVPAKKRILFFALVTVIFIVSLGVYYEIFKSTLLSTNTAMVSRGKMGGINPIGKLIWFSTILREAVKLHFVLFKSAIIENIFSAIIILLLLRDLLKKRFLDLLLLLAFSILVFLPHLIIAESWGASRNYMLISLLIVFYAVTRSFEILPPPSINVAALAGIAFIAIMCFNIREGWIKPMNKDYAVIYNFAKKLPPLSTDTLLVVVTPPQYSMHEKQSVLKCYYDEFLAPEFFFGWPIEPGIKCLYQDTHPDIPIDKIDKLIKIQMDSVKIPLYESSLAQIPLNLNYQ